MAQDKRSDEAISYLNYEIAALPPVARNDSVTEFLAFLIDSGLLLFCLVQ